MRRLLREHAPSAFGQLGIDTAAFQALAVDPSDEKNVDELLHVVDSLRKHRWEHELAELVIECVHNAVIALAHETSQIRTVISTWTEGVGPGDEISQSDDALKRAAKWRVMAVGAGARTVAHIAGGERGYVAEVMQQYAELYPQHQARAYEGTWNGLAVGKRYRVHGAFTDLDGTRHSWGESWQFDGCAFDPTRSEVRFDVSAGVQLDPKGQPGRTIAVAPFRLAISVGDVPGRAHDPIRTIITRD